MGVTAAIGTSLLIAGAGTYEEVKNSNEARDQAKAAAAQQAQQETQLQQQYAAQMDKQQQQQGQQAQATTQQQRAAMAARATDGPGQGSTILTGPLGLAGAAPTAAGATLGGGGKTLLGT